MKDETKVLVVLIAICIAGTVLRLYNLSFQCAWTDEQFTVGVSKMGWIDLITFTMTNDCNPPLYYLLVKLSGLLLGHGIIAARLISVFFGIALIPISYLLGKEFSDDILGLLVSGFIATSYPLIYYSQFARSYSMMIFLFTVALYYFLKLINTEEPKNRDKWMFGIFAVLAVYTHLFCIVPILFLVLWLVARDHNYKRMAYGLIVSGLPLLYLFYLVIFVRVNATSTFQGFDWFGLLYYMPMEFFGFAYAGIALCLVFTMLQYRDIQTRLLFLMTIATVFSLIAASVFVPVFPRYIFMIVPIFLILAFLPISTKLISKFTEPESGIVVYNKVLAVTIAIIFGCLVIQYSMIYNYYTVLMPYCTQFIP